MQEEDLRLRGLRVGALPILNHFIERMGLAQELTLALKNCDYADALIGLSKNILIDRNALYAVGNGPHSTIRGWSLRARWATTSSGALSIACLRRIAPLCKRASCWPP